MKELLTRIVSGIVYVILITSAFWYGKITTTILFLFFGFLCLVEILKLLQYKNYIYFLILPLALIYFVFFNKSKYLENSLLAISLFVNTSLLIDLFLSSKKSFYKKHPYIIPLFYIIPSFIFLCLLPDLHIEYDTFILLSIFILIWVNDSFAFLIGKNFGKRKLIERISPKKTQEGFIGGFIFTIITSFIMSQYDNHLSMYGWIIIAILVSILGTLGDLIQSKFKRIAQVKDSGKLIPGHGGIFDRMDSIIFSITFIYTFLYLTDYVS